MTATLPETATEVVLEVRDLVVEISLQRREPIRPVRGVSFDLRQGQRLGIVQVGPSDRHVQGHDAAVAPAHEVGRAADHRLEHGHGLVRGLLPPVSETR